MLKKTLDIFYILILAVIIDIAILVCVILQIANGVNVPHIPFWDWQINQAGNFLIWLAQ